MENHRKIMEFDPRKLLGTLRYNILKYALKDIKLSTFEYFFSYNWMKSGEGVWLKSGTHHVNHTIIGVCWGHRQAVSDAFSVLQLLCRLWTDLNEIGHGQSLGVTEQRRGVWILKFGTVAMEIWKCGLWGPIWPWRTEIGQPDPLHMWIILTHKFLDHLENVHFSPVSMEIVKSRFWHEIICKL